MSWQSHLILTIALGTNAIQAYKLSGDWFFLHWREKYQVRSKEDDAKKIRPHRQSVRALHRVEAEEVRIRAIGKTGYTIHTLAHSLARSLIKNLFIIHQSLSLNS